ncbi:hypothetical protein [Rubritalea profundi]|uniref:hypothetical protein n=1 Tax=Rubritalea profundi TaxID=1658618 RepID=UPI0013FDA165|nr:hypothetical protein [Rubritalea profundi]
MFYLEALAGKILRENKLAGSGYGFCTIAINHTPVVLANTVVSHAIGIEEAKDD